MSWLNPWVTRAGAVSSVELVGMADPLGAHFANCFRVGGVFVRYVGKPLPLREGEHAIVVGWRHSNRLNACFVALPGQGAFFRPYSAVPGFVFGVVLLFVAALVLAKFAVLIGLFLAAVAASQIFHAVAWVEGERLARQLMRRT